jgi:nucleotide-binding universal stress UspA family protein
MYRHILIPTDGSELAEHGVTNGLSLAKSVGAKVTVIVVEEPFNWLSVSETQAQRALEELAKHTEQIKKHAASVLNRAANAAKQAGVPCDTIQWRTSNPIRPLLQRRGTGAAISS